LIKDSDKPGVIDELTKREIDIIEAGSKSSLQTIQGDVAKLGKDFEALKGLLTTVEKSSEDDHFNEILGTFINTAQTDVENIIKNLEQTIKDFEALVNFFGEDLKENDPESFFGKWKVFLNNVFEAREKIVLEREKQEKIKRREEAKQRSQSRSGLTPGTGTETGGTTETQEGGERGRGKRKRKRWTSRR